MSRLVFSFTISFGFAEPPIADPLPSPPHHEKNTFFEQRVRPILVEKCFACHSDSKKKTKGGLSLESRSAILQGGTSGPAILPHDPEKSRLIEAIRYRNP